MDYPSLTSVEIIAEFKKRNITVLEYIDGLLERGERYKSLNAFIYCDPEMARDRARQADKIIDSGDPLGPLHGLPIVLKDNIDTADMPTTAGTPALLENYPLRNAPVARSLIEAGAIILGKANMHELAQGISNNNAYFGAARNPYNTDKIAGGSSGGCGALLAARLAPAAIGTDTGGSVRIPASLCGVIGFRPSNRRYSRHGIVPISHTRDTAGPMARSVEDIILLDSVMSGDEAEILPAKIKGMRFGIPKASFFNDTQPEVTDMTAKAFERLTEYGAQLVEIDLTDVQRLDKKAGFPIALYEMASDFDDYLLSQKSTLDFSTIVSSVSSPDVKTMLENALGDGAVKKEVYLKSMNILRPALQSTYRELYTKHGLSAIATPTTPYTAKPISDCEEIIINQKAEPLFSVMIRNTGPASVAGNPAISLPIGVSKDGLPVGMQIEAGFGNDKELLAIALAIEEREPAPPPPKLSYPS